MPITEPPLIPQITDPSTFAARAQDWVVWQADELYPFITDTSAILGLSTTSTSATSNTVGTGAKTFVTQTGKGFAAGQSVVIARTSAPATQMRGVVTSYDTGTGSLGFTSQAFDGTGTFTDWTITLGFAITSVPADLSVTSAKLALNLFNSLTTVTFDPAADFVAISDASDSGNNKKALIGVASTTLRGLVELAIASEIRAANATNAIAADQLLSAQGFTAYFQSADQTITSGGALTIAHGLGRTPIYVLAFLKNVSAVAGYTVGDVTPVTIHNQDAAGGRGQAITFDATNLSVRFSNVAAAFTVANKTTGAVTNISNADWNIFYRVWG